VEYAMIDPRVTVLMSVYNGEQYLREAIDSILSQTFTDFEFIIVNDGSTDHSVTIIESYKDPRIHLIHNEVRPGLPVALNRGIELARGEYIARMDSDDISVPSRLEKQVAFMDANPEIGVSGTWIKYFGGEEKIVRLPTDPELIRCNLFFGRNYLAHPSIILRKKDLINHNLLYDPLIVYSQDADLWNRCGSFFLLSNLPEVLLKYRVKNGWSEEKKKKSVDYYKRLTQKNLIRLGIPASEEELAIHALYIRFGEFKKNNFTVDQIEQWLKKLSGFNSEKKYYNEQIFSDLLRDHWFNVCYVSTKLGPWIWHKYWQSDLKKINVFSFISIIFGIKCLLKKR
jgi:glycosyltransferase involved in cell wall biosynthesis